MGTRGLSRRDFLRISGAGLAGASLLGVYGCGGGAGSANSGELDWASWANEGEAKRFKEYTANFQKQNEGLTVKYTPTPTYDDYHPKLLTQLNGGKAPDAFYLGDIWAATFVDNGTISELTELMNGEDSKAKPEDFSEGLWGPARTADGKIYGVPVDCNPTVLWYNKKVLQEAGIKEDPKELYEAGEWKWDRFVQMAAKAGEGKTNGYMLENGNSWFYSWCRQNGGTPYDGDTCIVNEDQKSVEAFEWMSEGLKSGAFSYAGSLPTGQASDAQFSNGQAAFVSAGRWLLPNFRQVNGLEYDIVPFPTNTDNNIEPGWVACAYMGINSKTDNEAAAFNFLTNFTGPEGQKFRLSGGGNAVPSVAGADEVVEEGNDPEGYQYFLDVRDNDGIVGYVPELSTPGLTEDMQDILEKNLWEKRGDGDVQAALDEVAQLANQKIQEQKEKA